LDIVLGVRLATPPPMALIVTPHEASDEP